MASGIVVGVARWDKWQAALIAAGIAALLSVVTSVASVSIGDKGTPSLVGDELTPNVAAVIPRATLAGKIPAGLRLGRLQHRSSIPRPVEPRRTAMTTVAISRG